MYTPDYRHYEPNEDFLLCAIESSVAAINVKPLPLCPFCPPGFLPDYFRRLLGLGLASPSEAGGLELFLEFLPNWAFKVSMVFACFFEEAGIISRLFDMVSIVLFMEVIKNTVTIRLQTPLN